MFGAGVEAGDLQQVLDQPAEYEDPVSHQVGGLTLQQQFGGGDQAHQRSTQFVGDVRGEALLGSEPVPQTVGHRVDRGRDLGDLVARPAVHLRPGVQVPVRDAPCGPGHPAQPPVGQFGGEGGQRDDDGERGQ